MHKGWLLAAALTCSVGGMAALALAMDAHWEQVRGAGARAGSRTVVGLRLLGVAALLASMAFCLVADHASMAVLVWVMSLAVAALVVTLTLAWLGPRVRHR